MTSLARYATRATTITQDGISYALLFCPSIHHGSVIHKPAQAISVFFFLHSHHDDGTFKNLGYFHLPASSGVRIWILLLAIAVLAAEDESALLKRNDMA
jgi:hypothetical protein